MKKGSRKKQYDQVDQHSIPTEPLPDLATSFSPVDQNGSVSGSVPYQDALQPLPVYPYLQNPSADAGRSPYDPSWSGTPPGRGYGAWPTAASDSGDTKVQPRHQRSFLPACAGLFFLCVQLLLIVRFGVRFLNLSPDIAWASVVTGVSAIFVLPFQALWFQIPVVGSLIPTNMEVYTLAAILIYGVLSRLLVGLLKVLLKSR